MYNKKSQILARVLLKKGKRQCPKCKRILALDKFYKWPYRESGVHVYCKYCKGIGGFLRRMTRKLEMIKAYGGKCTCCGEKEPLLLTLEHKNNSRNEHVAQLKKTGSRSVYRDLQKRGWPKKGFTCLCWNCNCVRGRWGFCPHQKKTNVYKLYEKLRKSGNTKHGHIGVVK